MKCKSCGKFNVDGRKQTVCDQCAKKSKRKEQMDRKIDRLAMQYIEDFINAIVKDADIKEKAWREQYTQRLFIRAVAFAIISDNKTLWALLREVEGKEREFFSELEDRVEKYIINKWFRMLIKEG